MIKEVTDDDSYKNVFLARLWRELIPKNEDSRQPQCPEDKERAIVEALKHFKMNR